MYSTLQKTINYHLFLPRRMLQSEVTDRKLSFTHKMSLQILRLQLHGAIYRPDSFVLMLRHCPNLKAIRYESTSFNRIVADKSDRVIVA